MIILKATGNRHKEELKNSMIDCILSKLSSYLLTHCQCFYVYEKFECALHMICKNIQNIQGVYSTRYSISKMKQISIYLACYFIFIRFYFHGYKIMIIQKHSQSANTKIFPFAFTFLGTRKLDSPKQLVSSNQNLSNVSVPFTQKPHNHEQPWQLTTALRTKLPE